MRYVGEGLKKFDEDLHWILVDKTEGVAAQRGRGLQAYGSLVKWFVSVSGVGLAKRREAVLQPKPAKTEREMQGVIEEWMKELKELIEVDPFMNERSLGAGIQITALKCLMPQGS